MANGPLGAVVSGGCDMIPRREGMWASGLSSSRKRRRSVSAADFASIPTPQRRVRLSYEAQYGAAAVYGQGYEPLRCGGFSAGGEDWPGIANPPVHAASVVGSPAIDDFVPSLPSSAATEIGLAGSSSELSGHQTVRRWKQSAAAFANSSLEVVRNQADPCASYVHDIEVYLRDVYSGMHAEWGLRREGTLEEASNEAVEEYYARLTEATYDTDRLLAAMGLDGVALQNTNEAGDGESSAYGVLKAVFEQFFTSCIEGDYDEEQALSYFVKSLPLEVVTTRLSARAYGRVCKCNGLAPDGHVLFSVFQGKMAYFHFGADREVQLKAIDGSDSSWQLAAHRCSSFVIGSSAAGKDTLIGIVKAVDECVRRAHPVLETAPCMNRLEQGHPTYNGLLSALQKGQTDNGTCCLMWYNSEIKQCIGVGERAIREEHLIQFAEVPSWASVRRTMTLRCCLTRGS